MNRLLVLGIPGKKSLFRFVAGGSLSASATFTRSTIASYTDSASDTLSSYGAGDSLASATKTRASTATYTMSV